MATETLRPNASGDETNIASQQPTSGAHWDKVDEAVADDFSTFLWTTNQFYERDLYDIPASSGSGTINFIKIYFRATCGGEGYARSALKVGGTAYNGSAKTLTGDFETYSQQYTVNPADSQPFEWADIDAMQIGVSMRSPDSEAMCTQVYVEIDYTSITEPVATTEEEIYPYIEDTTVRLRGSVADDGGEACQYRFKWWESGEPVNYTTWTGSVGTTDWFWENIEDLKYSTLYCAQAQIRNSEYTSDFGDSECFTTNPIPVPDAPTNVQATDGIYTNLVRITWTKSEHATGYQVYRDGTPLGWLGDVATHDDPGAGAPTITPGTAYAADGASTACVTLILTGESTSNGATHTYKVRARNASGESPDSSTNTGYRGVGSITYQWYRSAGDSNASYSVLSGATTDPYDDYTAPAPTVTPGDADASDGLHLEHVALSLSGQSANVGAGRYYKCLVSATGAASQYSTANRGYRGVGSLAYLWYRSAADSDANYSSIPGATTASYNDTGAPENGDGRYYKCLVGATGAVSGYSSSDRGYRIAAPVYYHGLKVQGVGELALTDVGTHPLRMRKGGVTYGVELVDTADGNASAVRIKTPTGIKAIRKYT